MNPWPPHTLLGGALYHPASSHSNPAEFRERMKRRAWDIERAKRELERQQADEIAANDEAANE